MSNSEKAEAKEITKDTVIGEVLQIKPEAIDVIKKYFGEACITCPGVNMESIDFGAMMHGVDPKQIIDEINAV